MKRVARSTVASPDFRDCSLWRRDYTRSLDCVDMPTTAERCTKMKRERKVLSKLRTTYYITTSPLAPQFWYLYDTYAHMTYAIRCRCALFFCSWRSTISATCNYNYCSHMTTSQRGSVQAYCLHDTVPGISTGYRYPFKPPS